jgi:hypothetical protein
MLRRSPQTISNSLTVAKEKLGARTLMEAAYALASARSKDETIRFVWPAQRREGYDAPVMKHFRGSGPYKR